MVSRTGRKTKMYVKIYSNGYRFPYCKKLIIVMDSAGVENTNDRYGKILRAKMVSYPGRNKKWV